MFRQIAFVALAVFPAAAAGQHDDEAIPKGVSSAHFTVRSVQANGFYAKGDVNFDFRRRAFYFHVNKDSQIEQADLAVKDGKPTVSMKRIVLKDLRPEQPISVIYHSDGKELTLLRAVAAGKGLGGTELAETVRQLGGTAKRLDWPKDRIAFVVDLSGTKTTDADLAALSLVSGMSDLDLSFTLVTDKGIAHLAGYQKLNTLRLIGTKVTNAAIESLQRIPDLDHLHVAQTAMTHAEVVKLAGKKSLFTLSTTAAGDQGRFRVIHEFRQGEPLFNYLMINDTYYGRYYLGKVPDDKEEMRDRRREATTYYHRLGPVGHVMERLEWFKPPTPLDHPSDVRLPASLVALSAPTSLLPYSTLVQLWSEPPLAVVRLNVGTHAAYGRPYQSIHFYNSSPELTTFSLPPKGEPVHFGFIRDARERGCDVRIIDGPERAAIAAKTPKNFYRAWFVDVTRNDLRDINTSLLTKESLADMMDTTAPDGILCFHVSHRYHDLVAPVVDAAASLQFAWKVGNDLVQGRSRIDSHFGSEWIMVARRPEHLEHLKSTKTDEYRLDWSIPASTGKHLWRDGQPHNLNSLLRALRK